MTLKKYKTLSQDQWKRDLWKEQVKIEVLKLPTSAMNGQSHSSVHSKTASKNELLNVQRREWNKNAIQIIILIISNISGKQ
jgi:hypothetical protein